ncbi:MAG: hypothetical protein ACYDDO_10460 [Acidiferrobacterales bacterium]
MNRYVIYGLLAAALLPGTMSAASAADQGQMQTRDHNQTYGDRMMTPTERTRNRNHMRNEKADREREHHRQEHHRQMQKRDRKRGRTIPDNPPVRGGNMGPGGEMGPGPGRP